MKKGLILVSIFCLCFCALTGCTKGTNGTSENSTVVSVDLDASNVSVNDFKQTVKTVYENEKYGFQLDEPKAGDTIAIMHTSMGDISIRFFPEAAPKAVENFITHAKEGYYDGLAFHRIIDDFMIQGGDPKGDGTGGESIWGKEFEDEFDSKLMNLRGSLSMANSGVNTNGSQFFINQAKAASFNADSYKTCTLEYTIQAGQQQYDTYKAQYGTQFTTDCPTVKQFIQQYWSYPIADWVPDEVWDLYTQNGGNIHLDGAWRISGGHTVFGQVYDGMNIVDAIAKVDVDSNSKPIKDVTIKSIEIKEYEG